MDDGQRTLHVAGPRDFSPSAVATPPMRQGDFLRRILRWTVRRGPERDVLQAFGRAVAILFIVGLFVSLAGATGAGAMGTTDASAAGQAAATAAADNAAVTFAEDTETDADANEDFDKDGETLENGEEVDDDGDTADKNEKKDSADKNQNQNADESGPEMASLPARS